MSTKSSELAGRRVLVIDGDVERAAAVADALSRLGAVAMRGSGLHEALDLLEAADPGFDAAVVGERLADGTAAVLARAIRTSPLLFELRVVVLADGPPSEGIDVACPWPATAAELEAALVGPVRAGTTGALPDAPVLDLEELESIAGGMTVEIVGMLRRFARQAQRLAAEAMAAAAEANAESAQGKAHALKGSAFSAGAMRLGHAAQSFEKAAAACDWNTASAIDLPSEARALADAIADLPEPA